MPNKKHHVKLTPDERGTLQAIARKENAEAIKDQKAGALPSVDPGGKSEGGPPGKRVTGACSPSAISF